MHRDGNHIHAARSQRAVRLVVITLDVAREESRLNEKTQTRTHVRRRNHGPASLRNLVRLCTRHGNGKFTHHGMLPRLVKGVKVAPQDLYVVRLAQGLHLLEAFLLLSVRLRVLVTHHQYKVIVLEAQQPHCKRRLSCSFFQETRLAVAYELQVRSGGEPRQPRKFTPGKCGTTLAFAVVVQDILAIVLIFDN